MNVFRPTPQSWHLCRVIQRVQGSSYHAGKQSFEELIDKVKERFKNIRNPTLEPIKHTAQKDGSPLEPIKHTAQKDGSPLKPRKRTAQKDGSPLDPIIHTAQKDGSRLQLRKRTAQKDGSPLELRKRTAQKDGSPLQLRIRTAQKDGSPLQLRKRTAQKDGSPLQLRKRTAQKDGSPLQLRKRTAQKDGSPLQLRKRTAQKDGSPLQLRKRTAQKDGSPLEPIKDTAQKDGSRLEPRKRTAQKDSSPLEPRKRTTQKDGPPLEHFMANSNSSVTEVPKHSVPYIPRSDLSGWGRKVYIETYGCFMNVNDTEIAWAILQSHGFQRTNDIKESDVMLLMTCSIREGAEQKIRNRLQYFNNVKTNLMSQKDVKIGVLGCMASRLKKSILEEEKMVDLVCGPDSYRDLPHMLCQTDNRQTAVSVALSLEETYADIVPVRTDRNSKTAFVSIMRGCDNMCTYCIVPFTRGRERSRPMQSILDEVQKLSDMGVKEVTLLGQNVNSYRDTSSQQHYNTFSSRQTSLAEGFKTVYRPKLGGFRFADLLHRVAYVDREMRIRFTSPHPKDFPDPVLNVIRSQSNICNQIHLPLQSGSSKVLKAMRRGYTRESYLNLVEHIRNHIPDVSLTTDIIAGFCGETEEDHEETLEVIDLVDYSFVYAYPYSMREKTPAYHRLKDDVPTDVKNLRHREIISLFREKSSAMNTKMRREQHLVLVQGPSKKGNGQMVGRNDANLNVLFHHCDIPESRNITTNRPVKTGDYIVVQILSGTSQTLTGVPLYHTTLRDFYMFS